MQQRTAWVYIKIQWNFHKSVRGIQSDTEKSLSDMALEQGLAWKKCSGG